MWCSHLHFVPLFAAERERERERESIDECSVLQLEGKLGVVVAPVPELHPLTQMKLV